MKPLIALGLSSFLACASTPDQPVYFPRIAGSDTFAAPQPDGGTCVLTRPSVDQQALARDLMPPDNPGGVVVVKCSVLATGEITNCRTLKDEAGLAGVTARRLHSMRGTPATCDGQPIDVDYVFNVRFRRAQ